MSARPSPHTAASLAHLRARLARRFALRDLSVPLEGAAAQLLITAPADPDAPLDQMAARQAQRRTAGEALDAMEQAAGGQASAGERAAAVARATVEAGAHLPYWALLWPSGLALAEALLAELESARGKRALELGCGLGVTAAVVCELGAQLTISDLFDDALLFAEYNVRRHCGRSPATALLNWRTPAGRERLLAAAPFDLLLAADVLYEPEDIEPLLAVAPRLLCPGASFWLAEPGRKASHAFVEAALARGWRDHPSATERAWPPDGDTRRVMVHRFTVE
ncbi:MAG TPA: methyltransferase [Ktedonobacterales bacterium]|jgi:predicted nicotinamide N-methyase|nr:methyltransferase [Ktedonobacterales bacterium]